MNLARYLTSASILFWTWQTAYWPVGIIGILLIEAAQFSDFKWAFSATDFNRIGDLGSICFAGVFIYLLSTSPYDAVPIIIKWVPIFLFPLMLAQKYSTSSTINLSALVYMMRQRKKDFIKPDKKFDMTYLFSVACFLGAGAANNRSIWFFVGLVLFLGSFLWREKPKRYNPLIWLLLIFTAISIGFIGHIGINQFQKYLMVKGVDWFSNFFSDDRNPYQNMTSMGDIGRLKPMQKIIFRTRKEKGVHPKLLHEASFNFYKSGRWAALPYIFQDLSPEIGGINWKISSLEVPDARITVFAFLKNNQGLLKLPLGATQVDNLNVYEVKRNVLGAFQAIQGPGMIQYEVACQSTNTIYQGPNKYDLLIPKTEKAAIQKIVQEIGLTDGTPKLNLTRIRNFFQTQFKYSLQLDAPDTEQTALSYFLLSRRAGHCEFFASATVLILRAIGLPSRYATGYVVHEKGFFKNTYVIRQKDAHAWAMAYFNGSWQVLDTTPSIWLEMDAETTPHWQFIADLWEWVSFQFSKWRWGNDSNLTNTQLGWILAGLVILLIFARYRGSTIKRIKVKPQKNGQKDRKKFDLNLSKFYEVIMYLDAHGFKRSPGETLPAWIEREKLDQLEGNLKDHFHRALALHNKSIFYPVGLEQDEKKDLEEKVDVILNYLKNNQT